MVLTHEKWIRLKMYHKLYQQKKLPTVQRPRLYLWAGRKTIDLFIVDQIWHIEAGKEQTKASILATSGSKSQTSNNKDQASKLTF